MNKAKHLRKLVGKTWPFAIVKLTVAKTADSGTILPIGTYATIEEIFGDNYIIETATEDNSLVGGYRYDTTVASPDELEFVRKLTRG